MVVTNSPTRGNIAIYFRLRLLLNWLSRKFPRSWWKVPRWKLPFPSSTWTHHASRSCWAFGSNCCGGENTIWSTFVEYLSHNSSRYKLKSLRRNKNFSWTANKEWSPQSQYQLFGVKTECGERGKAFLKDSKSNQARLIQAGPRNDFLGLNTAGNGESFQMNRSQKTKAGFFTSGITNKHFHNQMTAWSSHPQEVLKKSKS